MEAGDTTPQSGAFRARIDAEFLTADAASDDEPGATESLTQQTLRPVFVYSPFGKLNVVAQLPFVRKDFTLQSPDESEHHVGVGLGDIDVGARYFAWSHVSLGANRRQDLAFSAGTSLPTGGNDAEVNGERIDEHAQLGTGSFGPYLGALYALHQGNWTATASLTGRAHTLNSHGYRYGSAVLFGAGGQYLLGTRVGFGLGLDGRAADNDHLAGAKQENTGGFVLSVTPSAAVGITDELWLHAQVQVPAAHDLYGDQKVGPVFAVALQYIGS